MRMTSGRRCSVVNTKRLYQEHVCPRDLGDCEAWWVMQKVWHRPWQATAGAPVHRPAHANFQGRVQSC